MLHIHKIKVTKLKFNKNKSNEILNISLLNDFYLLNKYSYL